MISSNLIDKAKKYIKSLADKYLTPDKGFFYHNWEHFMDVYNRSLYLAENMWLSEKKIENISLAALFHDIWYVKQYYKNEPIGAQIAAEWLNDQNVNKNDIEEIKNLILVTDPFVEPKTISEMIISDADLDNFWRTDFFEKANLVKKEIEYFGNKHIDDWDFLKETFNFMNLIRYYTPLQIQERQKQFEKNRQRLIELLKEKNILPWFVL